MRRSIAISMTMLALTAGCATRRVAAPPVVATLPPAAPAPLPMPKGAYAGMSIPALMADGRYATPNRGLSADGAVWHLRAALNVAALACRGPESAQVVADYNTLLTAQKASLATAQTRLAAEYKVGGGDWQDRYDDAMTRLYNFFSQVPAHAAFCNAAAATLTDVQSVASADLPTFAAGRLAVLEKPFTDFYAAYDAWRGQQAATTRMASVTPFTPRPLTVQVVPAPAAPAHPRLHLDPSAFADTGAVTQ